MAPVVVVGAGIVGASITYHLARRGIPVRLLERGAGPGGGVTGDSFAWIGDSGGSWPGGAADLRGSVRADYERLAAELPPFGLRWSGSLAWTDGSVRPGISTRVGPGQRLVSREEIALLEPALRAVPESAVHTPSDGGVDPGRLTSVLVEEAVRLGAVVSYSAAVTPGSLAGRPGTVVVAAGASVPTLCPGVPVEESPALLLRASAPAGLVRTIVATPEFEVREVRPGELLLTALPDVGAAERAFASFQASFVGGDRARLVSHATGRRPMPRGGPIVGYVEESVYVAVLHSAVTLGPTVGRLVAEELATGVPAAELERCRPDAAERA